MRYLFSFIIFFGLFGSCSTNEQGVTTSEEAATSIQSGDLIFQCSVSAQRKAIQLATGSKYSHMGIIFEKDGKHYVYEAVQPVSIAPLKKWIKRGKDKHYVIKRLKNADDVLTSENLQKMKTKGEAYMGKDYDIYFDWSDEQIYCSELVWKIYKEALDIEIGELRQLKDFDLSSDEVKQIMEKRYGDNIPLNETVISPADMFESDLLTTVTSN